MSEEMIAFKKNQTWEIVEYSKGRKPVGCQWVFGVKYRADETLERYKVRLVIKGYAQTYEVDYQETFALVVKMNSFKVLSSLATNLSWSLSYFDVKILS